MTAGNRLKFRQSRAYESFIPSGDRGSRRRRYLSLKSIREKIDDAEVGKDQKDFNSGSKEDPNSLISVMKSPKERCQG